MLTRYPIVLALAASAVAVSARRIWYLSRLILAGAPAHGRKRNWSRRLAAEAREVAGQQRLLRWRAPGLAHALTFWGFVVLLLTIIEATGDLFTPRFAIPAIGHSSFVGFLEDFFAVCVLVAVGIFAATRWRQSPRRNAQGSRFFGSHTGAAWLVLAMIGGVIVTLLLYRAAQSNTGDFPYGWWAFASHGIGWALRPLGLGVNRTLETVCLDLNLSLIFGFLVLVVYSKHLHIFLAPLNIAFSRQPRALGALDTTPSMDLDELTEDATFGVGRIDEFSWKQLLDFATCTECGRCQSQCPAWKTDKPLSPKLVVMNLRDELFASAARLTEKGNKDGSGAPGALRPLVGAVVDPAALWSCTTCGACVEECPVDIEHVDAIVDLRRHEVLMESRFPAEAASMLHNIENRGDPWGMGKQVRLEWTNGLDFEPLVVTDVVPAGVEYLLWVGCAGALDERARETTRSIARLLRAAGVSFAILGPRESCTGDPARRLGNEYLYQLQAVQNIATLKEVQAHKVVVSCPHCFNSLAREYPALGGDFEVVHHSQLLASLIARGRLSGGELEASVTYHDPCYLGRHSRVFDEPRAVVNAIEGVVSKEMHRCRERGFCCGAGGARMWLEENVGGRMNLERTDEALATGADLVSTACPFCCIMLDDAVKTRGRQDDVEVLDIAQLLERAGAAGGRDPRGSRSQEADRPGPS